MKYCSECNHSIYQGRGAYLCVLTNKIVIVNDVPSEFHFACKNGGKRIAQISSDGAVIAVFQTVIEAARETQIHSSCIYSCLYKRQRTAGGYGWQYIVKGDVQDGNNKRGG